MTMTMASELNLTRQSLRLCADPTRVISRPYSPHGDGDGRTRAIIDRVLALPDEAVDSLLAQILADFSSRHRDITRVLWTHFDRVAALVPHDRPISSEQRLLIGSYFTSEYSIESVALFNPSIVTHPDQTHLGRDEQRVILSLRACGEGHISSIEFRSGVLDAAGNLTIDPISGFAAAGEPVADKRYENRPFFLKLIEMGAYNPIAQAVLDDLPESFTIDELHQAVDRHCRVHPEPDPFHKTAENLLWLARSNYHLDFPADSDLSERVIFPVSENESRGIEDARFVRFVNDDGTVVYYAPYTAYNGFSILPQFIETPDFRRFHIVTLNGRYAQNKGMAMFPCKLGGSYMMISRVDGESLYLMASENRHFWNEAEKLRQPVFPWEFMQIGNCGSPLETEAGWLLLTHGVGPMRRYCIGALLLDRDDPSRVIGHLDKPLLVPTEQERDGYVPNVVYSCGGTIHNDKLIIPYAMSDSATGVASVPLSELLDRLAP